MLRLKSFLTLGLGAAALLGAMLVAVTPTWSADKGGPNPIAGPLPYGPPATWTGVYVGGHAGYGSADAALSGFGGTVDGLAATGKLGGVDVGADWQLPGSFLVLGARASYTWNDVNFTAPGFRAGLTDGWSADGRIGVAMGTAMPYVFAGIGKTHTTVTGGGSPDLQDWHAGVGVELRLPKAMDTGMALTPTVSIEAAYTDYENKTFGPMTLNVTELSAVARLNLRCCK